MGPKVLYFVVFLWLCFAAFENGLEARELQGSEKEVQQYNLPRRRLLQGENSCKVSDNLVNHWAVFQSGPGAFYGTRVTMTIHDFPNYKPNQSTGSEIWIINESDPFNSIQAGWLISPELYGDSYAHFFTMYTVDGYQTCCYDTRCKGFVKVNGDGFGPGDGFYSLKDGTIRDMTIQVSKDQANGHWWLYYGGDGQYDNLTTIGYWPSSLFTGLADHATRIDWGGVVTYHNGEPGPPMGSGALASEDDDNKAAFFSRVFLVNEDSSYSDPPSSPPFVDDKDECYDLGIFQRNTFKFGGPGGCTD